MLAFPVFSQFCIPFPICSFKSQHTKTPAPGRLKMKQAPLPSSHIRFSKQEYLRLLKDKMMTGKSIPWLLKTAYFRKEISTPTLDFETRQAVRRELSAIGNNLNQLTKKVHTEIFTDLKADLFECLQAIKTLRSFLGQDYGDR
jgi:hypothetical protein